MILIQSFIKFSDGENVYVRDFKHNGKGAWMSAVVVVANLTVILLFYNYGVFLSAEFICLKHFDIQCITFKLHPYLSNGLLEYSCSVARERIILCTKRMPIN